MGPRAPHGALVSKTLCVPSADRAAQQTFHEDPHPRGVAYRHVCLSVFTCRAQITINFGNKASSSRTLAIVRAHTGVACLKMPIYVILTVIKRLITTLTKITSHGAISFATIVTFRTRLTVACPVMKLTVSLAESSPPLTSPP